MAYLKEPERQPFLRIPAATTGLIAVLVAAHVARMLAPTAVSDSILFNYAFIPARYSHAFLVAHGANPGSLWDRAIPFVSYIFLHGSYTHLAVNCVWLLPFGAIVARRFGAVLFFAFFLICGIAGAVAFLATNWGDPNPVVGASGAIAGLMAAGFRMIAPIDARDAASYSAAVNGAGPRALAPLLSPRLLLWSALFLAINLIAVWTGLGASPGSQQVIAWQAHIGGYLIGLLLTGPFDRAGRRLRS